MKMEKIGDIEEIVNRAQRQLSSLTHLKVSGVIGAAKKDDGWHIAVELIERKAVPETQDILGVYETVVDDKGNITNYQRKKVRRRCDAEEVFPESE